MTRWVPARLPLPGADRNGQYEAPEPAAEGEGTAGGQDESHGDRHGDRKGQHQVMDPDVTARERATAELPDEPQDADEDRTYPTNAH